MSKLWTHPNYAGGAIQPRRPMTTPREACARVREDSFLQSQLIDFFLIFAVATIFSALVTLAAWLYRSAHTDSDLALEREEEIVRVAYSGGARVSAREAFLTGMLGQQAFELKQQIHFVSAFIKSHWREHPEPEKLAYMIVSESFKANYDPLFVTAVIRSESMFKRNATSSKGARGLMQIMPETGRYVSKLQNIKLDPRQGLHDPNTNLKVGIAYLKYLEEKYKGNREKVLIAYNWGPGNLEQASKFRSHVPLETVNYARKIISAHRKMKSEYGLDGRTAKAANQGTKFIG